MEFLQRCWLLLSILVVLSVSWAVKVVMSKPIDTMTVMETEGALVRVQRNRRSKLCFVINCPICPPCNFSQKIPPQPQNHPRKMGSECPPPASPPDVSKEKELADVSKEKELADVSKEKELADVSKEKELAAEEHMKDIIKKGLKISGYVITVATLGQPFYMFWGTGSFMHTTKLYNEVNTACTALASYGCLLYGVVQVSYKDQDQIIGIDAIITNAINWAVTAFLFSILLLCAREQKGKVCICVLSGYVILTLAALHFPIFKWVGKKTSTKVVIGIIAGVCQGFSELIPIATLLKMWWIADPAAVHERIRHYKKFIILSRAIDCIVTIYWMLYCVFTYQFDAFGIGNMVCALLSLVSFVLHSAWAVQPPQ